jgi:tape measure domain-containing protein
VGTLANLLVKFTSDVSGFQRGANTVAREIHSLNTSLARAFQTVTGIAVLHQARQAIKGMVTEGLNFNATIQENQMAFENLLDSAKEANSLITRLYNVGRNAPLSFEELTLASKRMLSFKWDAESVVPTLTTLGDAAFGLGLGAEGVNRLVLAFGQMRARTKVTGEEMRQLTEAGIPGWKYLAEAIGVTTKEVMEMTQRGMIPAEEAIRVMLNGMERDFGGLMDSYAKSYKGMLTNIKKSAQETLGTIFKPTFDWLTTSVLPGILQKIRSFGEGFKIGGLQGGIKAAFDPETAAILIEIGTQIAAGLAVIKQGVEALWSVVGPVFNWIKDNFSTIGPLITGAVAAWAAYKTVMLGVEVAQGLANTAMLAAANPLTAIVAAAAMLTAGLYAVKEAYEAQQKIAIERVITAGEEAAKTEALISEYIWLKAKVELTADEMDRLNGLEETLLGLLPSVKGVIDDKTASLYEQEKALRLVNIAQNENLMLEGYLAAKEALPGATKELEAKQKQIQNLKAVLGMEGAEPVYSPGWQGQVEKWMRESKVLQAITGGVSKVLGGQTQEQVLQQVAREAGELEEQIKQMEAAIKAYEDLQKRKQEVEQGKGFVATPSTVPGKPPYPWGWNPTPPPGWTGSGYRPTPEQEIADIEAQAEELRKKIEADAEALRNAIKASTDESSSFYNKVTSAAKQFVEELRRQTQEFTRFVGIFDKVENYRMSESRMMIRMRKQFEQIKMWYEALEKLEPRLADTPGLMQEIRGLGPSYAKAIRTMAGMSDENLAKYKQYFQGKEAYAAKVAYDYVKVDHSGTIKLEGINFDELINRVIDIVSDEIRADASRYAPNTPRN